MSNNPIIFQDTSDILSFSSNPSYILDKSLYYNYYNDINQKPSFCNICFSANYNDIMTNKPNLINLSTSSNLYYSSNSFNTSYSNINYITSNNLINYNNNKLNNLNSSLWINSGLNIYSNLGSIGIGTSSFNNDKLIIKGSLKTDDLKIKGTSISNILITSNIFDNKSNSLYNSVSNQDYISKTTQITSSQFTTDINKNLYYTSNINNNYTISQNILINSNSCNLNYDSNNSTLNINYSNININSCNYNIYFEEGSIFYGESPYIRPIGAYFADDWINNEIRDSSGNYRLGYQTNIAITTGTINKITGSGNGILAPITYLTGNILSTIYWQYGKIFSIPTNYTIVSLTRYNGSNRNMILTSGSYKNISIGHQDGKRGVVFNDEWKTNNISVGNIDDWVCTIVKNGGSIPNNILIDGVPSGIATGGSSNDTLQINMGRSGGTNRSDWAFSLLVIYNTHLSDSHMIDINNYINIYKSNGNITQLKFNLMKYNNTSYPILKNINQNIINPIVWFKFDDGNLLTDNSGNNYNLSNVGVYSATLTSSNIYAKGNGSAIIYDSYALRFNFNYNVPLSLSFWIYTNNDKLSLHYGDDNGNVFYFTISSGRLILFLSIYSATLNSINIITPWVLGYKSEMWNNIIVILYNTNPITAKIYLNGVLGHIDNSTLNPTYNSLYYNRSYIQIGSNLINGYNFNGYIDDFRIYNLILTDEQIIELYKGRVEIFSSNTIYLTSNIGIGTSSIGNDIITIAGNLNVNDFKIKNNLSSNFLITSNILSNSSNNIINFFNNNYSIFNSSNWINSNSSVYLSSNGNLGIGSTIPIEKLDILGNLNINGKILPNSCNSFDLGSYNRKFRDLYLSGNSIYLDNNIIKNSNNYLSSSNININQITIINNTNGINKTISLNTNGDFMISNKYLLAIDDSLQLSNIVFSNVFSNSSNSIFNLNNYRFNSINSTDLIQIGSSNRFITNDIYNRSIIFTGNIQSYNLITSNLNIIGDTTTFNTTIYQTEQLFIANTCNYPAMIIKQININKNVVEFYNLTNENRLIVNSNGNVGIGTINPISKLNVIGNINSTGLIVNNNEIINFIKTNDSNYSNSIINSWNYSNNLYLSSSNSFLNISNSKQDLLKSSTILIGIGSNISNLNYSNVINRPDLSIYSSSVNSTSNLLYSNISNIELNSSNTNISYINTNINNLVKFQWNTNGNNIYTNSNVGIGSTIPTMNLDINGNLNANELLIKKENFSNIFITSNIFENRSNNYYSSFSNRDLLSSNSNISYINNIVNCNILLNNADFWKNGNISSNIFITSNINLLDNIFSLGIGSLNNTITSINNSLILSQNYIAKINYNNNININSGTYKVVFNNGSITFDETSYIRPWGAYFANDWSGNTLLDSSGNGRHATTSGTIIKNTTNGNGASGLITYLTGNTTAIINWPSGSIPTNFTILSLTRYTNSLTNQGRILNSSSGNWLLGYNTTNEGTGIAFFNGWKTPTNLAVLTNKTDWLCMIGKNGGTTPNNIIANGTGYGNAIGGDGGGSYRLSINNDQHGTITKSDWALSAVIIFDTHLSDAYMFKLNNFIDIYKSSGNLDELKLNILSINDKSYLILKDISNNNINPIAWYKFDDSFNNMILEASLNTNYNLVLFNNPTFDNTIFVKGNGSIYFNNPSTSSTQNYAVIPNNLLPASYLNTLNLANGLSFSFWINLSSSSIDYNRILYFGNFQVASPYYDNTNYRLQIRTSSPKTAIYFDIVKDGFYTFQYNANIYDNSWKYIVWTISPSGIWNIYINNSLICNNLSKIVFPLLSSTNLIYLLGIDKHPTNYGIIGNFDDFRIYNFVLTSSQVQELYTGRIDLYNINSNNDIYNTNILNSSNILIKGDLNIKGNIKLNNLSLNIIGNNIIPSVTGTNNNIFTTYDNNNFRYAIFISNGTFIIDNNISCDILIVGGGGGGGGGFGAGGGAGALIYKKNYILSKGTYNINIGSGGAGGNTALSTISQRQGTNGNDTFITNSIGTIIFNAKGGGGGGSWGGDYGLNGGSGGGSTNNNNVGSNVSINIPQDLDVYGNSGGRAPGYTPSITAAGGGGGAGSVGGTGSISGNGTGGNGGSGKLINITGINNYYAGGGGGCIYSTSGLGTTGNGGIGGGGNGAVGGVANGFNGTSNTGGGGGGASSPGGSGIGGNGGSGIVIIRYDIYNTFFNGVVNYSNIQNRPYMLDLLTSSNIINIGEENNVNFPSLTSWKNEWNLYIGTSPTNITNSFIFHHLTSTINSKWWFNGTRTITNAEISDFRIKNEIKDIDNGLDKLMLINPKEYYLCDDKDYHKKYGIIAQDIYQIPELNHLVYKDKDYIANVYSFAFYYNYNGNNIISSLNPIIDLININDELKILLNNNQNQEIIIEELTYHNRYKKRFVKVKSIIDDYSFEIFNDIELNEDEKIRLFIYGKKINDFHKLDYNSLYTLNIKANQEIYDIINNNYKTLDELTTRIKILENKLL